MLIVEPKQWPGQMVPYWQCYDDADHPPNEPDDWNDHGT